MIELQDLQVRLDQHVTLDIEHLQIMSGESVAIVGRNGAGKTTLFKALTGFVPITAGRVTVLGNSWGAVAPLVPLLRARQLRCLRAHIGLLWQALPLVNQLSVIENVMLGALARSDALPKWRSYLRWYPESLRERAWSALEAVGLQDYAHERADRLSGGERQKVAFARLSLQHAKLILADEPTSALDPQATQVICQLLRTLAKDSGQVPATLITIVHQPSLLPVLADRVIALEQGKVAFDRSIADVSVADLEAVYEQSLSSDASDGPSDGTSHRTSHESSEQNPVSVNREPVALSTQLS
jgi:phosphonate transport system ATP-binding protein